MWVREAHSAANHARNRNPSPDPVQSYSLCLFVQTRMLSESGTLQCVCVSLELKGRTHSHRF